MVCLGSSGDVSVLTTKTHDELLALLMEERKKNRRSSLGQASAAKGNHSSGPDTSPTPADKRGTPATTNDEPLVGSSGQRDESSDEPAPRGG